MKIVFACVQNAGRSQMAEAFACRERSRRDLDVEIVSAGTRPADHIHPEVVSVMEEEGFNLSDSAPAYLSGDLIEDADYIVTMGCDAENACPAGIDTRQREWNLADPEGKDRETIRRIRDKIERNVQELLDELLTSGEDMRFRGGSS